MSQELRLRPRHESTRLVYMFTADDTLPISFAAVEITSTEDLVSILDEIGYAPDRRIDGCYYDVTTHALGEAIQDELDARAGI